MYPPKFDYIRAGSVADAIALLQEHEGAHLLAGGHSLLPMMKLRLADPGTLIDIGRIESLREITPLRNGWFRIGALATHRQLEEHEDLPEALTYAASLIGDPQVRNRGTVGGSVAHADPASDLPTALIALGAKFTAEGPDGSRTVEADEYFVDLFTTALGEHEILTAVEVPSRREAGTGSGYAKLPNPASRYPMVNAAAVITERNGACESARVAIGALTPTAKRAPSVEQALAGQPLDKESIANAAQAVQSDLGNDLLGDIHASADYRREMAPVFVKRALLQAMGG